METGFCGRIILDSHPFHSLKNHLILQEFLLFGNFLLILRIEAIPGKYAHI